MGALLFAIERAFIFLRILAAVRFLFLLFADLDGDSLSRIPHHRPVRGAGVKSATFEFGEDFGARQVRCTPFSLVARARLARYGCALAPHS